jgi:hypothetical protein
MYRQARGHPTPSTGGYDMTLRSGKQVIGGKANITCYEYGIKGHYSNKCPKKLNAAPESTSCPRNHVVTEDHPKGRYSLNIHNKKEENVPNNIE